MAPPGPRSLQARAEQVRELRARRPGCPPRHPRLPLRPLGAEGRPGRRAVMLPKDQIPEDRRAILDFTGRLGEEGHNGVLAVALAQGPHAMTASPALKRARP